MDPGGTRQSAGKFPAGQTTGLCEYAYAFLCSTTFSGDNRNLPAGRKRERVNETFVTYNVSFRKWRVAIFVYFKLTSLLLNSFIDVYSLPCDIHHYCTSLYLITQYLCNLHVCDTTLHNRRWFGSCSLLVSLIVGCGPQSWSFTLNDPIYHHLVPKRWSPLLYTITLVTMFVPTSSVW